MADRKMTLMKGEIREPLSPISSSRAAARTPSRKIRPTTNRTPGAKTPSSKKPGVSSDGCSYDRFIPNRSLMDPQVSWLTFK